MGHTRGEVFVFGDLSALQAWKGPSDPKSRFMQLHRPHFRLQNGEKFRFLKKPIQTPNFLIQYVYATWARQPRKRKTSASNATSLLSLAVIILPIPKSWYRSPQNTRAP